MKIQDKELIDKYFRGYTDIEEKDGFFCLYRFGKNLREYYEQQGDFFGARSRCQSGVYICADNCGAISFDFNVFEKAANTVVFDALIGENGRELISFDINDTHFEYKFSGENVRLYFPYNVEVGIKNIEISAKEADKSNMKIFCFGDSITQGYYSEKPANGYPQVLGRSLNAEAYNFGIGGFYFERGILGDIDLLPKPDIITVAYGTNDWNFERDYKEEMEVFFNTLSKKYTDIPVFVLLPLPRKTEKEKKRFGTLDDIRESIENEAKKYDNFTVLKCGKKIAVERDLSEDGIHHDDKGMDYLGGIISDEIKGYLGEIA